MNIWKSFLFQKIVWYPSTLGQIEIHPLSHPKRGCISIWPSVTTLQYQIIMQQILINFLKKSNLHTLIPSCTFIHFRNFWPKTFIFTNKKRKSPTCMPLFHPACLLIFENLPSCTFIPSYMIIWYLRVLLELSYFCWKVFDQGVC